MTATTRHRRTLLHQTTAMPAVQNTRQNNTRISDQKGSTTIRTPDYLPDAEVANLGEKQLREYIRVLRLFPLALLDQTEEELHAYKLGRAQWELARLCPEIQAADSK